MKHRWGGGRLIFPYPISSKVVHFGNQSTTRPIWWCFSLAVAFLNMRSWTRIPDAVPGFRWRKCKKDACVNIRLASLQLQRLLSPFFISFFILSLTVVFFSWLPVIITSSLSLIMSGIVCTRAHQHRQCQCEGLTWVCPLISSSWLLWLIIQLPWTTSDSSVKLPTPFRLGIIKCSPKRAT